MSKNKSAIRVFKLSNLEQVKKISQHIDTLKFHYYIQHDIEDEDFHKYLKLVDGAISLKKEAQETKNNYGDLKSVNYEIGVLKTKSIYKFNVMATSISGFSVVLKNNDISIALRKTKNKINTSPVIKVEFRAEFLARKGYLKAVEIVNQFIQEHLLSTFKIKISEIHLATDIQGYDFTHLDFFRMKTRARTRQTHEEDTIEARGSAFGGLTTFTGFSFGGGDYHMRIYNKTKEITKFKSKTFAKTLLWDNSLDYDSEKTVWRLEIQIRRAKLKKLVNSVGSTMDDYHNILNDISSLWSRALTDYTIKDISDLDTFNMLKGKKTLKNGTEKLLTKNAIYGIFKRADSLSFWDDLKLWNGYLPSSIETAFKIPQNGSIDYVSNSIKSLYSTVAKHYGSVSSKTLIEAFKDSERLNQEKKQISLLEDSFNKQLDHFDKIDYLIDNGVCSVPEYKHLEQNIFSTVFDCNSILHDIIYTRNIKDRLNLRNHTQIKKAIKWATSSTLNDSLEAEQLF